MHRLRIPVINEILHDSHWEFTRRGNPKLSDKDAKPFMDKILLRFAEIIQEGYSVPRLIQAFYDHVTMKKHFLRFSLLYIYQYICQYYTRRGILDASRFIQLGYDADWYEAALMDFAAFLADRILLRFTVWSAHFMKRIGLTECGPSITPKPSAIRDENRCLITGTEYIGQLRDVYVIPPNFVPSITHESPEGGGEDFSQELRQVILCIMRIFDPDLSRYMLDPTVLESPVNSLTLHRTQHELFSSCLLYFEGTSQPFQWCLWSPLEDSAGRRIENLTLVRLQSQKGIEAPSGKLLNIHRSITRILAISGAKGYTNWMVGMWEKSIGTRVNEYLE